MVRNESKIHDDIDTDEIHVVAMRVDGRSSRYVSFQLRVHSRDHGPPGRAFRTRTSTLSFSARQNIACTMASATAAPAPRAPLTSTLGANKAFNDKV